MLPGSRRWALALCFFTWPPSTVTADSYFFPNNTFYPYKTVNTACSTALQASVNCSVDLLTYAYADTFYPLGNATYQKSLCSPSCGTALSSYINTVTGACAGQQPFEGLPATYYGNFAQSTWNLTCLQDPTTGEFCIDYLFGLFANFSSTQEVLFSQLPASQLCTKCTYLMFQQIQGTPYSNYQADIAADWAAVQSICKVSFPTAVPTPISNLTSIPGYAPTNIPYNTKCLSGNTYTAVSGDSVQAIAQKNNVATGTLIAINNLLPDGSDLEAGQVLCLPYTCQLYTVVTNDTCYGIATAANINLNAFLGYNPTINNYCSNLLVGRSVCVTPPGGAYNATTIAGAVPTQTAIYASTTVAPPGPTAHGTTANCGKYYQVQSGDFCQVVAINQTISLPLFEAINPSIDLACDNLVPGLWYCVSPLQYWNQTGTPTTPTEIAPPTTTPDGTTDDCYQWYVVQPNDNCALVESSFGVTFSQLQIWNPDLNDDCFNLLAGEAYCVDSPITSSLVPQSSGPTSAPPSSTSGASSSKSSISTTSTFVAAPTTTASGTTSSCYKWYVVVSGDTCTKIDTTFSITLSQFLIWNTGVNSGCTNIQVGLAYCVSSPITQASATSPSSQASTTTSKAASSTVVAAPTSTVSGTTSDCFKWYVVKSGDTCSAIDTTNGITLSQFLTWNTGVNSGCTNIEVGIAYCVSSPIAASSKVKREIEDQEKREDETEGVRGWPVVKPVWKMGLPPKFPGLFRAYDKVSHGEL